MAIDTQDTTNSQTPAGYASLASVNPIIPVTQMSSQEPLTTVNPPADTTDHSAIVNGIATQTQAQQDADAAQANVDAENKANSDTTNPNSTASQILSLMGQENNKAADTQSAQDASGATALLKQLNDLDAQIQNVALNTNVANKTLEGDAGTGYGTAGFTGKQQAENNRQAAIQSNTLAAKYNVLKGNYDTAMTQATNAVNLKYAPIEANIATLQQQYDFNKDALTAANAKAATALQASITEKANAVADAKQTAQNNVQDQNTYAKAAMDAGQSDLAAKITALDPTDPTFKASLITLQSQVKQPLTQILDIQNKQLQNEKLQQELTQGTAAGGYISPAQQTIINSTLTAMASNKQIANFQGVQDNYNVIQGLGDNTDPASQAAALSAFVQMAVPGSKSLRGSASVITGMFGNKLGDALINAEKTVNDRGSLTPGDIKSLQKAADIIYGQQATSYNNTRSQYVNNLTQRGVQNADSLLLNFAPQLSSNPNLTAANITGSLQSRDGKDGYVSPDDYNTMKHLWVTNGGNPVTFDNSYGNFKNPNNNNY